MKTNSNDAARALVAAVRTSVRLGVRDSAVLSARVPLAIRERLDAQAKKIGLAPSVYLRGLVMRAASRRDPEATLASIARLLGLDPDTATPGELQDALTDLLLAGEPPANQGATAETADPAPPATAKALTKQELAYCEREKITPEQFRARTARAVKRTATAGKAR
jgi:hypothetical protein